ncbi:hypothetical protein IGI04_033447 [Brassica rapa subsp. trilocularis]|uniref:Uncharacterized protein n=1 Tax=Brassica rapa subsp. trilocularis TaxID=1813537 RepID=A0ABQ7L5V5_BRACM|nr:hypothetical protein IGI04_033447 [Brassica rapa subsp. trilocularis]
MKSGFDVGKRARITKSRLQRVQSSYRRDVTDAGKYGSTVLHKQKPPLRLTSPSSRVHAARRLREPKNLLYYLGNLDSIFTLK